MFVVTISGADVYKEIWHLAHSQFGTYLHAATLGRHDLTRTKEDDVAFDKEAARQIDDMRVTYCPLDRQALREWTVEINIAGSVPHTLLDAG